MLIVRELDTPLDLVTQPVWEGMEEPDVPYSERLWSSLREVYDHARAVWKSSHDRQKLHYDNRHRSVSYSIGDLVRLKTHPKSDALTNFIAKLAPLYSGLYCVTQVLSGVNYRLVKFYTRVDAGVFYVGNMQPFHTRDQYSACTQSEPRVETESSYEILSDIKLGPTNKGEPTPRSMHFSA